MVPVGICALIGKWRDDMQGKKAIRFKGKMFELKTVDFCVGIYLETCC